MLLQIDDSVIRYASASHANGKITVVALENLAIAYRKGFHIITGSPFVFRWLRNNLQLGTETRATIQRLEIDSVQTLGLCSQFSRYVRIVSPDLGAPRVAESNGVTQCSIPVPAFMDFDLCAKTILMGENLNDAELYHLFGSVAMHGGKLSGFKIQADKRAGGGRATDQAVQSIQNAGNRFCLCFLDSDKDHPTSALGDTAQATMSIFDSSSGLVQVLVTRTHELENALPIDLLTAVYASTPAKKTACERLMLIQNADPQIVDYADIKLGISGKGILSHALSSPGRLYWTSKLGAIISAVGGNGTTGVPCVGQGVCANPAQCFCVLVFPLGTSILEDVLAALASHSPAKLSRKLGSSADILEYGRNVWEACCGTAGMVV